MVFSTLNLNAQEKANSKIDSLKNEKSRVMDEEKAILKRKVENINKVLKNKEISLEEANILKENAAKIHAINIEHKIALIDNKIDLLKRNNGNSKLVETIIDSKSGGATAIIGFGDTDNNSTLFGVSIKHRSPKKIKYDNRTSSALIVAFGLNNALIDNQSLDDSPYKVGGSRFFELGWQWQTRVFKNSNFLRFNYGLSLQFNGLKPKNNQYFVSKDGQTELQEFDYDLKKSKLRMDNLVFPVHFEFGPSKVKKTEKSIRYSTYKKFKFGVGGYGGFNLGTRQKLKYKIDGEKIKDKIKREYNTPNFVYGLSTYVGFGDTTLYLKYDLNPIFKDALVEQQNISLGLRFQL